MCTARWGVTITLNIDILTKNDRCKMVDFFDFFDVHSTHKWCQELVWASFSTPNACKTCRKCFWEVLKFSGFFMNFFEDHQISICGDVFWDAPHDGHLRGTWKYIFKHRMGVKMGGNPVLWLAEQSDTVFRQFVFLNQVFWTPSTPKYWPFCSFVKLWKIRHMCSRHVKIYHRIR